MTAQNLYSLPKGWVWTKLSEVIDRVSNGITQRQEKQGGGIQVTRIETISNGSIDLKKVGYLKGLTPETVDKYRLIPGDVLFSHINSDLHLGKTALFNLESITLLHGMNLLLIRSNDALLPEFLHYLSAHYRYSGVFLSIAQHAVNQSSINQAKLKNLDIPLPPLLEQHRIVSKVEELFTKLDAGAEALQKIKAQLKRYRQAVLKHAFEGNLTKEWREAHKGELDPASVLLDRIREERKKREVSKIKPTLPVDMTELTVLPEGWAWTRVGELFEISYGLAESLSKTEPDNDLDIPVIRIPNVTQLGSLDLTELKYYPVRRDQLDKLIVKKGDILFNWRNAPKWIGKSAVFDKEGEFVNASFLLKLRPYIVGYSHFISYYLNYLRISGYFLTKVANAVNQANFNATMTGQIEVVFPTIHEQHVIVEEIERRFSIADEIEKVVGQNLQQTRRLRESILKKAFEGKLVPQDPNDEPAQRLLERIRDEKAKQKANEKAAKGNKTRQLRMV